MRRNRFVGRRGRWWRRRRWTQIATSILNSRPAVTNTTTTAIWGDDDVDILDHGADDNTACAIGERGHDGDDGSVDRESPSSTMLVPMMTTMVHTKPHRPVSFSICSSSGDTMGPMVQRPASQQRTSSYDSRAVNEDNGNKHFRIDAWRKEEEVERKACFDSTPRLRKYDSFEHKRRMARMKALTRLPEEEVVALTAAPRSGWR